VLCPYNYLLDPVIRTSLPLKLSQSCIIFDEAHNIEEVSRSSASLSFNITDLADLNEALRYLMTKDKLSKRRFAAKTLLKSLEALEKWIRQEAKRLPKVEFEKEEKVWRGEQTAAMLGTEIAFITPFICFIFISLSSLTLHLRLLWNL